MQLTVWPFVIVCPLVFIGAVIDAIGGGGGLITLPAFLFAGLPPHMAVATNKLSSTCGTSVVTTRMIKNHLIDFKLAVPSIACAIIGSGVGSRLSLMIPEEIFLKAMIVVLPVCAFLVLNRKLFNDEGSTEIEANAKTYFLAGLSALIIGGYDGIYGPGTGTFLIIAFTIFAKINMQAANGQAKIINLTTNVTSLVVFLINGQVLIPLGIAAAVCNMMGGYIGAGLAIRNGSKIIKPCIILVLTILLVKIIFGL
ncbi:MAG: TSUP family transporter [Lachnospiraceae bacterium]|nr:TSUP family transporter [Lachnospiraceae bacterium]